jgi:hypothetical protein
METTLSNELDGEVPDSISWPSLNHLIVIGGSPETTEQTADARIPSSRLSGNTNGLITMRAGAVTPDCRSGGSIQMADAEFSFDKDDGDPEER